MSAQELDSPQEEQGDATPSFDYAGLEAGTASTWQPTGEQPQADKMPASTWQQDPSAPKHEAAEPQPSSTWQPAETGDAYEGQHRPDTTPDQPQ